MRNCDIYLALAAATMQELTCTWSHSASQQNHLHNLTCFYNPHNWSCEWEAVTILASQCEERCGAIWCHCLHTVRSEFMQIGVVTVWFPTDIGPFEMQLFSTVIDVWYHHLLRLNLLVTCVSVVGEKWIHDFCSFNLISVPAAHWAPLVWGSWGSVPFKELVLYPPPLQVMRTVQK